MLELIREQEGNDEHSDCPTATNRQVAIATTSSGGQATPSSVSIAPGTYPAPSKESHDIESNDSLRMRRINSFLMEEIDPARASGPLTAYCFMTGFIDAVSFSAMLVWSAFQTGNFVQLAIVLVQRVNGQRIYTSPVADLQALCSMLSFIFGAFIGRIGDKIGCKTRMWMTLGTFIQTIFTMSAGIVIWKSHSGNVADSRGDPAWTNALSFVALGFISASMGLQGIMGKRLNTQFTTTIVFTTTWYDLVTEPQLFILYRLVASRDHRLIAIVFLFLGCFSGAVLLNKIGDAGTLGIGTGLRFVVTLWWFLVPAKQAE